MPKITDIEPGWYCFMTLPKKEHIAADIISRRLGLETVCPRITRRRLTRTGRKTFTEALFPCYLFVGGDVQTHYRSLMATQGIKKILSSGDKVPMLAESFIEEIKALDEDGDGFIEVPDLDWKDGEEVTILEGPFRNLKALVSGHHTGPQRVAIMLDLLGQNIEFKVDINQLQRTNEPHASQVLPRKQS